MSADDVTNIEIRSGVNERGEGFLTVVVTTAGNRMLLGQLDPQTGRQMAMDWLATAEAAEQDAAVMRCIKKLDLPVELAAAIVTELRESRAE